MFQNIINTINNQPTDDEFVSHKPDKGGPKDNNEKYEPRKFTRNRRHQIVYTENDIPDNPYGNRKWANDDEPLDKGPQKKPKVIVKASVHFNLIVSLSSQTDNVHLLIKY